MHTLIATLLVATSPTTIVKVELNDGQVLRGTQADSDADHVVLAMPNGSQLSFPRAAVRQVVEEPNASLHADGTVWQRDPNRTRYFYAPSAMMLKHGEVNFSQKELLFSSVGVGVTDWFSVQAGAVVPAFFIGGGQGLNFIGAVKFGAPITDRIHLAAGAQTLVLPFVSQGFVAGFGFGSFTYGTPDAHVTLSAGVPFMANNHTGVSGDLITVVAGNLRVGRNVALVTENWIMPSFKTGDFALLNSGGVRLMGEHVAVDLGGVWVATSRGYLTAAPIPWLDFTWNF